MDAVDVTKKLRGKLIPITVKENADAAVSLLLKCDLSKLEALFVKRTKNPNDPWSGQIALPGGKRDSQDLNLQQTAIRETFEETNIDLTDNCQFIGRMPMFESHIRPEMRVLPFVVLLERNQVIQINEELDFTVWISLDNLTKNRKTIELNHRKSSAFVVREVCIWGLTYKIVNYFLGILEDL